MKKVIFATGNQGKMKEIREILGDLDIELLSLKDAGIHDRYCRRWKKRLKKMHRSRQGPSAI